MSRKPRLNRHAAMRKHKRELKKKYGHGCRTNLCLHEAECKDRWGDMRNARNGGYQYWQLARITGPRQLAKTCTNRVIRAMYRDMLRNMTEDDMEAVCAMSGADYEKMFDYDYTIW